MSSLQPFGREREPLYFLTASVSTEGSLAARCLVSGETPSQKNNENWQQKRINCSLCTRKTSVCPRNLHNKDEEDPSGGEKKKKALMYPLLRLLRRRHREIAPESPSPPRRVIKQEQNTNLT